MEEKRRALVLLGIKHCGKSTQGRLLSAHFSCPLYDSDDMIATMTGKNARALYTTEGEAAFMAAELAACKCIASAVTSSDSGDDDAALASAPIDRAVLSAPVAVIATGGGICKNEAALAALHAVGLFVFLAADEKTAADRIVREIGIAENGALVNLPAYIAKEQPQSIAEVRSLFHHFYVARTASYRARADITVNMLPVTPEENMRMILAALAA